MSSATAVPEAVIVEADLSRYAQPPDPWMIHCAEDHYADASLDQIEEGSEGSVDLVEAARSWLSLADQRRLYKLSYEELDTDDFSPQMGGSNPAVRGFDVLLLDFDEQVFAQLYVEQTEQGGFIAILYVRCVPTA
ncbi:MAG: hypothetical protein GY925_08030 [Actinomycetia bacterium]|nr:hypothetical protein [Actinomycetes bacterium]